MSMHNIEGLVEDSIILLEKTGKTQAEKRDLFYNLYRFQNLFDTGYTHFRVIDILLKNKFTYRFPLEIHPDFESHKSYFESIDLQKSHWLIADVEAQRGSVYAEEMDGRFFLFVDAGDLLWQRLCYAGRLNVEDCRPPREIPLPTLVLEMMKTGERAENTGLLYEWYACFAGNFFEGEFSVKEGISKKWNDWLENGQLLAIREMARRYELHQSDQREDEEFPFPDLQDELEFTRSADENAIARFLLDLSKDVDAIQKQYDKENKTVSPEDRQARTDQIPNLLSAYLEPLSWNFAWSRQEKSGEKWGWLWYRDIQDGNYEQPHRKFILVTLDISEKWLVCRLGFQHALILQWQGQTPAVEPKYWHCFQLLPAVLSQDWVENNNNINGLGAWRYDIKTSQKTLAKKLNNLIRGLELHNDTYFQDILSVFPKRYFKKKVDTVIKKFHEGDRLPQHILFDCLYCNVLLFLYKALEDGDREQANTYLKKLEDVIPDKVKEDNQWYKDYLKPFLTGLNQGQTPPLPPLRHHFFHNFPIVMKKRTLQ